MDDHEICPVCSKPIHKRAYKRHLVAQHGWRYAEENPDMPVEPSSKEEK